MYRQLAAWLFVAIMLSSSIANAQQRLMFWVRLKATGGADAKEILIAANRAVRVALDKQ